MMEPVQQTQNTFSEMKYHPGNKNHSVLPASPLWPEMLLQLTVGSLICSPDKEKAVVYRRVSGNGPKGRSFSKDYRPDRAEEYARAKGWRVVASYVDPACPGKNSKRPGLQAMIQDIESGGATVVIVNQLNCLYLIIDSLLRFLRFLRRHYVRLISIREQIDSECWWGRLVLNALGDLGEIYLDQPGSSSVVSISTVDRPNCRTLK